jgi:hypothetical protein
LAMDLVISDGLNPRAAMAALAIVRTEAEALDWASGVELTTRLVDLVAAEKHETVASTMAMLGELWDGSDQLARGIVSEFLASPVDPRVMGHSE